MMGDTMFNQPLDQHLINLAICVGILLVVDHGALKPYLKAHPKELKPSHVTQCRWFLIHAFANSIVCVTAVNALYAMATDPVNAMNWEKYHDISMFGNASVWPLTMVCAVHVYHMIGGFGLTDADYFHHLMFIPALGFPGMVLPWGPVHPAGAFFISGFPGGVCYAMLALLKLGYFTPMIEKRWTANLNNWCRTPGILVNSFLVYQAVLYGNYAIDRIPFFFVFLLIFLPPYNALYYNKQACANFAVHWMNNLLCKDEVIKKKIASMGDSVTAVPQFTCSGALGELNWKDAIAVPQRGC